MSQLYKASVFIVIPIFRSSSYKLYRKMMSLAHRGSINLKIIFAIRFCILIFGEIDLKTCIGLIFGLVITQDVIECDALNVDMDIQIFFVFI